MLLLKKSVSLFWLIPLKNNTNGLKALVKKFGLLDFKLIQIWHCAVQSLLDVCETLFLPQKLINRGMSWAQNHIHYWQTFHHCYNLTHQWSKTTSYFSYFNRVYKIFHVHLLIYILPKRFSGNRSENQLCSLISNQMEPSGS